MMSQNRGHERNTLEASSDEELMVLYCEGKFDAFTVLYHRHKERIYSYITKKLNNRQVAEEILQQVFLKIHDKRENFKAEFLFLPWAYTITKNTLIDELRKNHHTLFQEFSEEIHKKSTPDFSTTDLEEIPSFKSLSSVQQDILKKRYIEELEFHEISKSLDLSETNIRKIISRALKVLRGHS